jgi:hypothetical protein
MQFDPAEGSFGGPAALFPFRAIFIKRLHNLCLAALICS